MRYFNSISGAVFSLAVLSSPLFANESDYLLVIKDHVFEPSELTIPAGKRVKLIIDNQDVSVEEFESHDLHVEKIIPGNTRATVWVGPLKQGQYRFFGEFNEDTAQGTLISE